VQLLERCAAEQAMRQLQQQEGQAAQHNQQL
jgi:hypothetical protein